MQTRKIEMVDLQSQYARLKPEIDEAIAGVLRSSAFIRGPEVNAFRDELAAFTGARHVIPCANGTDALQAAVMALDLQPGDEVITSNFTFIATVEVLLLLGLKPVLADVDPASFNIDPACIDRLITPRTRAIIPVHLFGQPADMDAILEIAGRRGLYVIEDNAQSIGSEFAGLSGITRKTGTIGHIGTTSFFPTKPLACYGDGGALMTNDAGLADKLEMIVNHGARVKYHHEITGINSRLDSLQAAILRVNLRHFGEFTERRTAAALHYNRRLAPSGKIALPATVSQGTHVWHQYTVRLDPEIRDSVRNKLKESGIPSMIYYPEPLSLQPVLKQAGYRPGDFPVSEALCRSVLSLPLHTEMDAAQIDRICDTLINILENEPS